MKKTKLTTYSTIATALASVFLLASCSKPSQTSEEKVTKATPSAQQTLLIDKSRLSIYHPVDVV